MAISEVLAGLGAGTGALGNINGSSGYSNAHEISNSNGFSDQNSWSYGQSASQAYTNMDAWSQANSVEDSWNKSWNESQGESYGRTYGREASAQDILNAHMANKMQNQMWRWQAQYNQAEAQKTREWQQYMTDTYYQRLVEDLKLAGLNPILALSGYGASTPTGATASAGLASSAKANAYAEQTSGSYNWSKGGSEGGSHGESHSSSQSTERSRSSSSSLDRSGSTGHSENSSNSESNAQSQTTNNIKELTQKGWNVTQKAVGALKEIYDQGTNAYKHYKNSSSGGHSY